MQEAVMRIIQKGLECGQEKSGVDVVGCGACMVS